MYVKPFITEIYSTSFFMEVKMYSQKKYSQRKKCIVKELTENWQWELTENIVPGTLCIIWKLKKAWSLKKDSVTFLWFFDFLILKKNLNDFLTTLKKENTIISSRLVKVLILKNDHITFLWLLKFFKIAIL